MEGQQNFGTKRKRNEGMIVDETNNSLDNNSEDGQFLVNKKRKKTTLKSATLEEKVEFMKKLTQISTAYGLHVSKQINSVMQTRTSDSTSEVMKFHPATVTSDTINRNSGGGDKNAVIHPQPHSKHEVSVKGIKWSPEDPNLKLCELKVPLSDCETGCDKTLQNPQKIMNERTSEVDLMGNSKKRVGVRSSQSIVTEEASSSGLMTNQKIPELTSSLFVGTLKNYQVDGVEWLKILYENAVSGILADEMGLGKTIQTIALLCHLIMKNVKGPFLIIAPLSTLPNWMLEFKTFSPQVPVMLFHGPAERRRTLMKSFSMTTLPNFKKKMFPVIITSYETPLYEKGFFSKYKWKYIVVDEGHRLKNHNSVLSRFLHSVVSENRLLLTGTPLQNNLEELWSLLHFLTPEIFGDVEQFDLLVSREDLESNAIVEQEVKEGILSKMHMALSPFILRRMKKDVNLQLPPKKEVLVYAPMSRLQWELYNATIDGSISHYFNFQKIGDSEELPSKRRCTSNVHYKTDDDISDEEENDSDVENWCETHSHTNMYSTNSCPPTYRSQIYIDKKGNQYAINLKMQNPFMQLKKLCNHPYLVQMPIDDYGRAKVDNNIVSTSGKMMVLDVLLPRLKAKGHKVLLFSTMTQILDIIEDYVVFRGYEYCRLDGSVTLENRTIEMDNFNEKNVFLFLISTRAGGLGLNLAKADTVIIFDSDWNPQADLQAQDRCHRIGQTKPVIVYRFVTTATIDERIIEFAQRKRRLEKLVLHNDCYKGTKREKLESFVSIQELKDLLASKDFSKVVHTSGMVLKEEDINELVDRSQLFD